MFVFPRGLKVQFGVLLLLTNYFLEIIVIRYLPTAGDMDREPLEPVGLGVGLKCGVVARPALPLPPESLLFWPVRSCNKIIASLAP